MTEHFKAPEKIQLSDEEIANLSDAQFKALVINMLTDLVESIRKTDEKMKPMLRETKENVQGTNSDAKETGTQINSVDQKEERNIQPEKNEETRIQKNEERLRNLQDIFKCSNIQIMGMPEEEEEQEIENLFEKIMAQMTEHFKAPEIIQLSSEQIANLSDAQFKTLVIKKLTQLVEFGRKLDEKMKTMLRETKENVQGTNSYGKETGTQINSVDQKEERNIQPEKNEETRIQKN